MHESLLSPEGYGYRAGYMVKRVNLGCEIEFIYPTHTYLDHLGCVNDYYKP